FLDDNASAHRAEGVVTQFHGAIGDNLRILDDNATAHRANIVLNRIYELGIPTLPLPPRSPDLKPIEHAWDKLQLALENHSPVPQTMAELTTLLPRLWQAIPAEDLNHLVESMPRRVRSSHRSNRRLDALLETEKLSFFSREIEKFSFFLLLSTSFQMFLKILKKILHFHC
ncbi:hypothetical protein C0J52_02434, partial [Blattella germanica]